LNQSGWEKRTGFRRLTSIKGGNCSIKAHRVRRGSHKGRGFADQLVGPKRKEGLGGKT